MNEHRNPDGTYNGIGALAGITGLSREEVASIAEQVKANQTRLNGCLYHDFEPVPGSANAAGLRQKYRCRNCGGEVDAHAYHWHEQGRRSQT